MCVRPIRATHNNLMRVIAPRLRPPMYENLRPLMYENLTRVIHLWRWAISPMLRRMLRPRQGRLRRMLGHGRIPMPTPVKGRELLWLGLGAVHAELESWIYKTSQWAVKREVRKIRSVSIRKSCKRWVRIEDDDEDEDESEMEGEEIVEKRVWEDSKRARGEGRGPEQQKGGRLADPEKTAYEAPDLSQRGVFPRNAGRGVC